MSKSAKAPKSKLDRAKDLPWIPMLQLGVAFGDRWRSLSEKERARFASLLRESGGRLGSLTSKERKELRKLAGKLDLKGLGGEVAGLARRAGFPRGRRRG